MTPDQTGTGMADRRVWTRRRLPRVGAGELPKQLRIGSFATISLAVTFALLLSLSVVTAAGLSGPPPAQRVSSGQSALPAVPAGATAPLHVSREGADGEAGAPRWIPTSTTYTLDSYNRSLLSGNFDPPSPWYPTGAIAIPSRNEFVVGDAPGAYIDGLPYNGSIFVLNATTGQEVRAIQVGNSAMTFGYNPSADLLYAGESSGTPNSVFFVNLSSGDIVRVVQVFNVVGFAYDPANGILYVSNWSGVVALNATTGAYISTLFVHWGVAPIVLDPLTNSLLVADNGNGIVYVVNTSTFTVSSRLTGIGTVALLYDAYSASIYSLDWTNNVSVIDARTLQLNATKPDFSVSGGDSLALNPAGHIVYLGSCGPGVCGFYDTNDTELNQSLKLANYGAIAFDPVANHLLAYDLDDSVHLFNGTDDQPVATVSLITSYLGGALDTANGLEYIATPAEGGICQLAGAITVLDPSPSPSLMGLLPAGNGPSEVAYDSADQRVFVTNYCSNSVTVVDAANNSIVRLSLPVGSEPYGIAYDSSNDTVWVANENSQNLTVLNGSTLATVRTVHLPQGYPYGLAWDPQNHSIFVSDIYGRSVTVLDAYSFAVTAPSLPAGNNPQGLLYDPQNGFVYVANGGSDNISVLNATSHQPVGAIPTVAGTSALALDPEDHLVFATDTGGSRIVVVDTLNETAQRPTLPASQNPEGVLYDPLTHQVDVPNFGTGAITVLANPPVISDFRGTPSLAEVGNDLLLSLAVTNGTPPYMVDFSGLPPGCLSANLSNLWCTPSAAGTFSITATVTDSAGYSATASVTLPVASRPASTGIAVTPNAIDIGLSAVVSWNLSGGILPWSYSYQGLPPGCVSANASVLACVPTATGMFSVRGTATDGRGEVMGASAVLVVNPVPVVTGFIASLPTLPSNTTTLLAATTSGGTAPLTYLYGDLPPGCATANSPVLSCTPSGPGTYTVALTVTDALGWTTTAGLLLTVVEAPPPPPVPPLQISAFLADPSTVVVGGNLMFDLLASGGTPPYSTEWTGLPPGCSASSPRTTSISCRPSGVGTFSVRVNLTDAVGRSIQVSTTVTVEAGGPPIPAQGVSESTWIYATIGAALLGGAMGAGVVGIGSRRRGRAPPRDPNSTAVRVTTWAESFWR